MPLTLQASAVGLCTRACTEVLDLRRLLAFASCVHASGEPYHDDTRPQGPIVHPGFLFALQFAAQGLPGASTARAGDFIGAVHAESDLVVHRPLHAGQVVTTQGRLVARRQLRSGVHSVERYRVVDERGELLAELDFNLIFRGAVLVGGDTEIAAPRPRPAPPAGGSPQPAAELHVGRDALHHYTAGSGIHAPIHTERRVAQAAGFPDIVLHGSALKSIALSCIVERHFDGDASRVRRLYGQLRAVVPAGTAIRIEVLAVDDARPLRHVWFRVLNHEQRDALAHGLVSGAAGADAASWATPPAQGERR